MKIYLQSLALKNNYVPLDFISFVKEQDIEVKSGFNGSYVEGESSLGDSLVEKYKAKLNKIKKEEQIIENKRKEEEQIIENRKRVACANMLITSGFNFDGYKIKKYSGYISGDDAVQIPRSGVFGGNDNGSNLTDALVQIRRQALKELKEAAYDLGCNAVIGVDFDYITLEPQTATITGGTLYEPYVICVTANGNAVIIEKEE